MKMNRGASIIVVIMATLMLGTTGCQSGWKFSNPFSRHPSASNAGGPRELDELDELNEITPPPENYTSNDSNLKSEKSEETSLAQKGKYDSGEESSLDAKETKETKVALNTDGVATEKPADNFATPDYSQNYQASNPLASGVGSTADYGATQIAQNSVMDQFANANAASVNTTAQPQQNALAANQAQQANYANYETNATNAYPNANAPNVAEAPFPTLDVAANPAPFPNAPSFDNSVTQQNNYAQQNYPAQNYELANQIPQQNQFQQNQYAQPEPATTPAPYNPIAQVSGSTSNYPNANYPNANTAPAPTVPQETPNLAYNYDAASGSAPAANPTPTPGLDSATNPYSNVIYEPQNVSGGFAPGSVIY